MANNDVVNLTPSAAESAPKAQTLAWIETDKLSQGTGDPIPWKPFPWKPYDFSRILTPVYWCRWNGCYNCVQPFSCIPIYFDIQTLLVSIACLAVIGITAASADCDASGSLSTFAGLGTFIIVPHSSVFTWIFGIPFERALDYHKMFAYVSVITGFIHFGCCSSSTSGYMLLAAMVLLVLFSQPFMRRRVFETFYKLHWVLFMATFLIAITHESASLMCFGGLFFLFDVFYRYFFLAMRKYPRQAKAYALPAKVIKIVFPKGQFNYRAGQYIFLCIPELTSFQWHPFSISSSPNQEMVSIHIRVLGDWTADLYDLCQKGGLDGVMFKVLMEGPYGEPAIDIDGPKYKSFLLISGGIGVTPMQSICNDLVYQFDLGRPLNKIWFVWSCADKDMVDVIYKDPKLKSLAETTMESLSLVSRMPTSFSPDTLCRMSSFNSIRIDGDVENQDSFDPLYSEYYLTRVRKEEGFADANINPDVQECLRFGRPNLDRIFARMKEMCLTHKDERCAVMVCGPMPLIVDVRKKCAEMSGGGVTFDYHHEVFNF